MFYGCLVHTFLGGPSPAHERHIPSWQHAATTVNACDFQKVDMMSHAIAAALVTPLGPGVDREEPNRW